MIKTERPVLVNFQGEAQSDQLVDKFLFPEHIDVGMIGDSLERYSYSPLPGLDRLPDAIIFGFSPFPGILPRVANLHPQPGT